jgi:hypothetical protein
VSNRRRCEAPGCSKRVKAYPMCSAHWFALPSTLRHRVWNAFRRGVSTQGYINAVAAAREVLGAEVAVLEELLQAALAYHDDCGHGQPGSVAECDAVCRPAVEIRKRRAWRSKHLGPPAYPPGWDVKADA